MKLHFLTESCHSLRVLQQACLRAPFAPETVDFLDALSRALLDKLLAQQHPEVTALGFWLRRAHIKQLQRDYWHPTANSHHRALGTVLHIAPGNVDTMFVYSWVCSLLMGNRNIVRVSSRDSVVIQLLLDTLNQLFEREEFAELAASNAFVSYPRDDGITQSLSSLADARVIWGGDETVSRVRALAAKLTTRDIAFADKYSVSLIQGDAVNEDNVSRLVEHLWRDTHPYQQMACSSPRVIFWVGCTQLQSAFQELLVDKLRLSLTESDANERLVHCQSLSAIGKDSRVIPGSNYRLFALETLRSELLKFHPGSGFYFWIKLESVAELVNQLDDKCQTISCWLPDDVQLHELLPILKADRIVPIGQALDFAPVWDGYHLFSELSHTSMMHA